MSCTCGYIYEPGFPKYFVSNWCYSDSIELMETIEASFDHLIRENPMGEARKDALKLDFDRRLKLEFHGTKVTSEAGLLACRELDDALGLTTMIDSELCDNRTGKHTQHSENSQD